MSAYDLTQLRDDALIHGLDALAAQDRKAIARLMAHVAEVDARRLYAPAGYSSMHAYCVEKLHLSEGAAWQRIHVAKKARALPQMFEALARPRAPVGVGPPRAACHCGQRRFADCCRDAPAKG